MQGIHIYVPLTLSFLSACVFTKDFSGLAFSNCESFNSACDGEFWCTCIICSFAQGLQAAVHGVLVHNVAFERTYSAAEVDAGAGVVK